jgi:hypothetical protein
MPIPTAAALADYLREHPVDRRHQGPEVLCYDQTRTTAFVRWPTGTVRWETLGSLHARGFVLPVRGVLDHARTT